eukprot:TCONS_00058640-protein
MAPNTHISLSRLLFQKRKNIRDLNPNVSIIVEYSLISLSIDLPGLNDEEDELNDPRPFRVRFRGRRMIRRIGRIRIRVDKLKCPLRCAAYYTCLAKSSGIARMFCYKLKKSCKC